MDAELMTMTDEELEREQHVARNGIWHSTDPRQKTARFRKMQAIMAEWERRYAIKMKRLNR